MVCVVGAERHSDARAAHGCVQSVRRDSEMGRVRWSAVACF